MNHRKKLIKEDYYNYEKLTELEKTYVLSLKDHISSDEIADLKNHYLQYDENILWELASKNKTVPELAHSLIIHMKGEHVSERWRTSHALSLHQNTQYLLELDRISILAKAQDLQLCLIENGSIIRTVYRCAGCFSSRDLDVLIKPGDRPMIDKLLLEEGYEKVLRHAVGLDPLLKGWQVYKKEIDPGVVFHLNIQWLAVLRRWLPIGKDPSVDTLFHNSVEVDEPDTCIRILNNEYNLFILALHTASHSYIKSPGFRLHLDVERWVKNSEIDWDKFIGICKKYNVCRRIFPSLYFAREYLGTPIPEFVLTTLIPKPRLRKNIISLIAENDLFNPDDKKFSRYEYLKLDVILNDFGIIAGITQAILPSFQWMKLEFPKFKWYSAIFYYGKRIQYLITK